jgi:uncharacterized protein (TIGR00304 family)
MLKHYGLDYFFRGHLRCHEIGFLVVYSFALTALVWLGLLKRKFHLSMEKKMMDASLLYSLGIILIAVGIIIVILAVLLSVGKAENVKVKGAGVIMIGPIPIIFGSDKKSVKTVLALALALTIAFIVLYYFLLR